MIISRYLLLLLATFFFLNGHAHAADNCSVEQRDAQLQEVRAAIGPDSRDRVYLRCDLTLSPNDNIKKRLVMQGDAVSGVTINCNGATLDGGEGTPNAGDDMIIIQSLWVEK